LPSVAIHRRTTKIQFRRSPAQQLHQSRSELSLKEKRHGEFLI